MGWEKGPVWAWGKMERARLGHIAGASGRAKRGAAWLGVEDALNRRWEVGPLGPPRQEWSGCYRRCRLIPTVFSPRDSESTE